MWSDNLNFCDCGIALEEWELPGPCEDCAEKKEMELIYPEDDDEYDD